MQIMLQTANGALCFFLNKKIKRLARAEKGWNLVLYFFSKLLLTKLLLWTDAIPNRPYL